jgi:hypothetical protein
MAVRIYANHDVFFSTFFFTPGHCLCEMHIVLIHMVRVGNSTSVTVDGKRLPNAFSGLKTSYCFLVFGRFFKKTKAPSKPHNNLRCTISELPTRVRIMLFVSIRRPKPTMQA